MGNRLFRNSEGYHDPTAGLALQRISREEKRRKKAKHQERRKKLNDTDGRKHNDSERISGPRVSSGHSH